MSRVLIAIAALLCIQLGVCQVELSLNGVWKVQNANGTINVPATVPGQIHTDLMAAGVIGDPYFRFGDADFKWVAHDNWTYSRSFSLPASVLSMQVIELVLDGVDTIALVFLNGQWIGTTNNMFLRFVFDAKPFVRAGNNVISVHIESAVTAAAATYATYAPLPNKQIGLPPLCPPPEQHGECHINMVRKEQCSFSWDWGPSYAPMGIYRNISILAYDFAAVRYVVPAITPVGTSLTQWTLAVSVYMNVGKNAHGGHINMTVTPAINGEVVTMTAPLSLAAGEQVYSHTFPTIESPQLWWPNGYGDANLYYLFVTITPPTGAPSTSVVEIGFRSVVLDTSPVQGMPGQLFRFIVNNVPVFMKGANFIPTDAFESRVNESTLAPILHSAADSNMNVLRVWGGGLYQQDAFYTLCDRLGLMVWEEFMFACAMYPADENFLSNVRAEATHQVLRLASHPALILWSGSNEDEAALAQNWYGTAVNFTGYEVNYEKLTFETLKATVNQLDPTRVFLSSSPSNANETASAPVAANPQAWSSGDVHFYTYTQNCLDTSIYPIPRFASEYGFESWSSFPSLASVSTSVDWSYNSTWMNWRQHHPDGNTQILWQIAYNYLLPNSGDELVDFQATLYMSQVAQAMCIKTETEHYRRHRGFLDSDGHGYTMGTIYWQLNDIWPTSSWASIEYSGRWKMLQYYVRKAYEPINASPWLTTTSNNEAMVSVGVASDSTIALQKGALSVNLYRFDNLTAQATFVKNDVEAAALSSAYIWNMTVASMFAAAADGMCVNATDCFVTTELQDSDGSVLSANFLFLSPFTTQSPLADPQLSIASVSHSPTPQVFTVVIEAQGNAPALFVWLETSYDGRWSDNGFIMTTESVSVQFVASKPITASQLQAELTVTSYYNVHSARECV